MNTPKDHLNKPTNRRNLIKSCLRLFGFGTVATVVSADLIARAWRDPVFAAGLSEEIKKQIPSNPAGNINTNWRRPGGDTELAHGTISSECNTMASSCNTMSSSCNTMDSSCNTMDSSCNTMSSSCNTMNSSCNTMNSSCNTMDSSCTAGNTCNTRSAGCTS